MPRVTAVTVHHRGRDMLGACLESLLASTGVELEVVVVANACDEELPEVVASSSRVHVVRSERSIGFSAANNLGVGWARKRLGDPDFYYFLNNDTWSTPEALERLVATAESSPRGAAAGPRLLIQWAPDHLNSLGLNVTEDAWGWDEGIGIRQDLYGPLPPRGRVLALTGSAMLVRAAVLHAVGGWTELYDYYFEDIDLCLKVWGAGYEVMVEPDAVVLHAVSATMTLGSDRKVFLFWRNRLLLALAHWPAGRLWRVLRRALGEEVLGRRWPDSRLQRRALAGALGKLPRALAARWRWRGRHTGWVGLLRPAGSVPVITLPTPPQGQSAVGGAAAAPLPDATWASARALAASPAQGRTVLVLGWAPLPFENARMNYAPGGRTWQLARPLAADGHRVCVVCAPMPGAYHGEPPPLREETRDGVLVYWLERELFDSPAVLPELVRALDPEVLVGATAVPSQRAVRLAGARPVWVDLFGDPMAEAQARALSGAEGEPLGAYRDLLAELLDRGDAFSAVSDRQRWAVLGQLGLAGRLSWATAGTELAHTIPCAVEPRPNAGLRPQLPGVADDDFVVLWSGGYNTWCDVETLAVGLRAAMDADPRVRFVSTGDAVVGHDDATYRRWTELVEASARPDRFQLLGALPADEAERWRRRADLALVTERPIVERALGSSGRVAGWLASGIPVACTATSELGEWLERQGVALTYPPGDGDALARLILDAASDPERVRRMGQRARELAVEAFSPERSTEPLRSWVRCARRAPDAGRGAELSLLADERTAEWQGRYHEVRAELGHIHQSRMWRLWMLTIRVRGALGAPLRWLGLRGR